MHRENGLEQFPDDLVVIDRGKDVSGFVALALGDVQQRHSLGGHKQRPEIAGQVRIRSPQDGGEPRRQGRGEGDQHLRASEVRKQRLEFYGRRERLECLSLCSPCNRGYRLIEVLLSSRDLNQDRTGSKLRAWRFGRSSQDHRRARPADPLGAALAGLLIRDDVLVDDFAVLHHGPND